MRKMGAGEGYWGVCLAQQAPSYQAKSLPHLPFLENKQWYERHHEGHKENDARG
jgi:hypothetical protein